MTPNKSSSSDEPPIDESWTLNVNKFSLKTCKSLITSTSLYSVPFHPSTMVGSLIWILNTATSSTSLQPCRSSLCTLESWKEEENCGNQKEFSSSTFLSEDLKVISFHFFLFYHSETSLIFFSALLLFQIQFKHQENYSCSLIRQNLKHLWHATHKTNIK